MRYCLQDSIGSKSFYKVCLIFYDLFPLIQWLGRKISYSAMILALGFSEIFVSEFRSLP